MCVLHVLDLSERQAADAVRCRIDFKYALALDLDDPGFHHSVLSDFRDHLTEGDHTDHLLDLTPARLEDAGLVRERATQRTDSTHVLFRNGPTLLTVARFTKGQCRPCPVRAQCTTSRESPQNVGSPRAPRVAS